MALKSYGMHISGLGSVGFSVAAFWVSTSMG